MTGAVALALLPAYGWPLDRLPLIAGALVLALMMRALEPGPRQPRELLRRSVGKQIVDGGVHALAAFAFALLVIVAVCQPGDAERVPLIHYFGLWMMIALGGIAAVRLTLAQLSRRWRGGPAQQLVAVYGTGDLAERLVERLAVRPETIGDRRRLRRSRRAPDSRPGLRELAHGTTAELVELSRRYEIDRIVVALPHSAEQRLIEILRKLHKMPVEISPSPDMVGFNLARRTTQEFRRLAARYLWPALSW